MRTWVRILNFTRVLPAFENFLNAWPQKCQLYNIRDMCIDDCIWLKLLYFVTFMTFGHAPKFSEMYASDLQSTNKFEIVFTKISVPYVYVPFGLILKPFCNMLRVNNQVRRNPQYISTKRNFSFRFQDFVVRFWFLALWYSLSRVAERQHIKV